MTTKYLVNVDLPERGYSIHIQRNGMKHWKNTLKKYLDGRKCLIISDSNVYSLYADKMVDILTQSGAYLYASVFPAGESSKSLDRMGKVYHKAASAALDRNSVIVALGGGVTGDISGFVAATWMRGIDYIQIPTSLLAMVDSSVGGKTGVDLPEGKNLVGAFWQPKTVLIDPAFLKSLPDREFSCGMAEIIKYGMILDDRFFNMIEREKNKINQRNVDILTDVITRCCQIKAAVVQEDERECGIRMVLNYGHTIGHALESVMNYEKWNHGECIAVGMCMATEIAIAMGLCDEALLQRQESLLQFFGLPVRFNGYNADLVMDAMLHDKKLSHAKLRFVLPVAIGSVKICKEIDPNLIKQVICGRAV